MGSPASFVEPGQHATPRLSIGHRVAPIHALGYAVGSEDGAAAFKRLGDGLKDAGLSIGAALDRAQRRARDVAPAG